MTATEVEAPSQAIFRTLDRRRAGRDVLLREKCGPPRERTPAGGGPPTATDEPDGAKGHPPCRGADPARRRESPFSGLRVFSVYP